jgi:hypothetical protein
LTIIALDEQRSLEIGDFDLLPRRSNDTTEDGEPEGEKRKTLMEYFDEAEDSVWEDQALEGTVLAWARGWRNTCGKGAVNKQVKVVKVSSKDLFKPGQSRKDYLEELGQLNLGLQSFLGAVTDIDSLGRQIRVSYRISRALNPYLTTI